MPLPPDWYLQWKQRHGHLFSSSSSVDSNGVAGTGVTSDKTGNNNSGSATHGNNSWDASVPPERMFLSRKNQYGSFDAETGAPLTDAGGVPLTKSARKKLRKLQELQKKKHEKWKNETGGGGGNNKNEPPELTEAAAETAPAAAPVRKAPIQPQEQNDHVTEELLPWPSYGQTQLGGATFSSPDCIIVAGSFGKRQGLEFKSDMGPFCHVFEI